MPAAGSSRPSRRTRPPAPTASRSFSIPPTAATAIRSSTAPTAGRGSRSFAGLPTTALGPRWQGWGCARLPRRVRGSRRPALPRPADRLPRLRSAAAPRGRDRRRRARSTRPRPPRRCWRRARSWPSRASAAITWPARATDERAVARLRARKHREEKPFALMAAASTRRARWSSSGAEEETLCGHRGPDRPRAPAQRRARGAGGRAARPRAGRDAALHAAAPCCSPAPAARWS